jgi:hypothetical protein
VTRRFTKSAGPQSFDDAGQYDAPLVRPDEGFLDGAKVLLALPGQQHAVVAPLQSYFLREPLGQLL